jgi:serine phosphatase RsbU (regulator of sigma subunit)
MKLQYIRAGHEPLIIHRRSSNELIKLKPTGRLIGIFDSVNCSIEEIDLQKNDRIILYTDGISEAVNKNYNPGKRDISELMFGGSMLDKTILNGADLDTKQFSVMMLDELHKWTGEKSFEDDVTFVIIDV